MSKIVHSGGLPSRSPKMPSSHKGDITATHLPATHCFEKAGRRCGTLPIQRLTIARCHRRFWPRKPGSPRSHPLRLPRRNLPAPQSPSSHFSCTGFLPGCILFNERLRGMFQEVRSRQCDGLLSLALDLDRRSGRVIQTSDFGCEMRPCLSQCIRSRNVLPSE